MLSLLLGEMGIWLEDLCCSCCWLLRTKGLSDSFFATCCWGFLAASGFMETILSALLLTRKRGKFWFNAKS